MFQLLETFVHIVEQETLVKAAATMHLTQPTVSRHVQQLEQQCGMPLFDRIGKKLVLNRAGELVYRYAKRHLALAEKMRDELNSFTDPEVGNVYLGAGLTPSIYLLPPLLALFREQHPGVTFYVRTGSSKETLDALMQREVDVGIVTTFQDQEGELLGTPLLEDDLLLVAAPTHPLAERGSVTLEEAVQYPFVLMKQGSGLRKMLADITAERDLPLTIAMETDSLESISRLVQHGVGISCLPRSSAMDDVGQGRLRVIQLEDVQLGARTITLAMRKDSIIPACAAQFCTYLRQWFASKDRRPKQ
jgi:DNA-binding transcriptional LysR family regulator